MSVTSRDARYKIFTVSSTNDSGLRICKRFFFSKFEYGDRDLGRGKIWHRHCWYTLCSEKQHPLTFAVGWFAGKRCVTSAPETIAERMADCTRSTVDTGRQTIVKRLCTRTYTPRVLHCVKKCPLIQKRLPNINKWELKLSFGGQFCRKYLYQKNY